jgi:hypothetical protein
MNPRHTNLCRMMRNGRVFDRSELRAVLEESTVCYGWFFFGPPLARGESVEPVNVPRLLERSAFVVDVLEGNMLGVRTIHRGLADELRSVIVGVVEVEPCELEAVQLMY